MKERGLCVRQCVCVCVSRVNDWVCMRVYEFRSVCILYMGCVIAFGGFSRFILWKYTYISSMMMLMLLLKNITVHFTLHFPSIHNISTRTINTIHTHTHMLKCISVSQAKSGYHATTPIFLLNGCFSLSLSLSHTHALTHSHSFST